VKEKQEAEEVTAGTMHKAGVAAFFDLDGTLVAGSSLERRFFRTLRYRHEIAARNYLLWMKEAIRLAPGGINQVLHANKMYLRNVRTDEAICKAEPPVGPCPKATTERIETRNDGGTGEIRAGKRMQARMPVPAFYEEAILRVAWHAGEGHTIMLVSGTLDPLAQAVALVLLLRLGERGIAARIGVCATRLEAAFGKWTGRIVGEAMFGEAKERAIRRIAAEAELDLQSCYAYGNSASDRWMLGAVGKPVAVNPSDDLARAARRNDWPVLRWGEENNPLRNALKKRDANNTEQKGERIHDARANSGCGT
jgi:HAD superfamily phosphoserine phosphatase-like hydrolase